MVMYIIGSYLFGTLMTAWFVSKWFGQDLRTVNSGNLGARNAGRALGKGAFVVTALGDVGKGALVVIVGRLIGLDEIVVAASVLAVVCGHLFPFWLKGRGGKGVATVLGAMLFFSWQASIVFVVSFGVALLVKRSATLGFIAGLVLYNAALLVWQLEGWLFVTAAIWLVIWKHRSNILERMR